MEEIQALFFIFDEGIALAIRAQVDATAQVLHRFEMIHPEKIDRLQKKSTDIRIE